MTTSLHFHVFSIVFLMGTSFCGLNSTSVDKLVLIYIQLKSCKNERAIVAQWEYLWHHSAIVWSYAVTMETVYKQIIELMNTKTMSQLYWMLHFCLYARKKILHLWTMTLLSNFKMDEYVILYGWKMVLASMVLTNWLTILTFLLRMVWFMCIPM